MVTATPAAMRALDLLDELALPEPEDFDDDEGFDDDGFYDDEGC
jgi:hypothetical protein